MEEKNGSLRPRPWPSTWARHRGSTKFPIGTELLPAVFEWPLCGPIVQYKVRAVLAALDVEAQSAKSPVPVIPTNPRRA